MNKLVIPFLILAGCDFPSRYPTESELLAVEVTRYEWEAAGRGNQVCPVLDAIVILELPQEDLNAFCLQDNLDVKACTIPTTSWGTVIAILETLNEHQRHSIVIHESLHYLRTCWVLESGLIDIERYRTGETQDCDIYALPDHEHCDTEAWGYIEDQSFLRWLEWKNL